jgi:hypothetical protein
MLFIGLNPSTASELQDDPTIRRLVVFARDWGYGGLYACNLFSQVTPYPKELKPVTHHRETNYAAVNMAIGLTALVLCGWGDGIDKVLDSEVELEYLANILEKPKCFGLTQSGNPRHPLYLPKDSKLEEYL